MNLINIYIKTKIKQD